VSIDYDRNLFGEIERFIKIQILGKEMEVPDKLELLRVFQFLDYEIDYARLCWNGSCQRCFVKFKEGQKTQKALSCRLRSVEGMQLVSLPSTIKPKKPNPE